MSSEPWFYTYSDVSQLQALHWMTTMAPCSLAIATILALCNAAPTSSWATKCSNPVTFHGSWMEDWVKAWEAAQPSSTHANHSLKQKLLLIALQSASPLQSAIRDARLLCSFLFSSNRPTNLPSKTFLRHAIISRGTRLTGYLGVHWVREWDQSGREIFLNLFGLDVCGQRIWKT